MWLALGSGLLGALAAAAGKLSLSSESPLVTAAQAMCSTQPPDSSHCWVLTMSVRAGGLLTMLALNAGMMRLLLQALTKSHTAYVTLSATSANFIVSVRADASFLHRVTATCDFQGVIGGMFFGEPITLRWTIGFVLILIGMVVLKTSEG